ncbi:MAG: flavodoxin family protein [Rhodanobacteraceae bacterium]
MKATILLGTLKRSGLSNTQALCEFLVQRMERRKIHCEIVRLVDHEILPGTCSDMGAGDAWPGILKKVLGSEIVIFATPIWWGIQSSEIQRVIERLDEVHDDISAGKSSPFEGKAAGIVITGDSDGAEHVIGNLCNFFNAIGLLIPPYATLSVLWDKQAKDKDTPRKKLLEKYKSDYADTADKMILQLKKYAGAPKKSRGRAK